MTRRRRPRFTRGNQGSDQSDAAARRLGTAGLATGEKRFRTLSPGIGFSACTQRRSHRWTTSDEAKVIATLVSASIADPVERWLFAEPLQYLTQFARFVAAFGSGGFERETVFSLGDFAAVAIWIPPGAEPDPAAIVGVLAIPSPLSSRPIRSRC